MYNRMQLIFASIVLYILLLMAFPLPTTVISITIVTAYFAIMNIPNNISDNDNVSQRTNAFNIFNDNGATQRRTNALRVAGIFLTPYNNIWRNLKLVNKFCVLSLGSNGTTIRGKDKNGTSASFTITDSKIHSYSDLWDIFCLNFSYNTTYDGLKEMCQTFKADISENTPAPLINTETAKIVIQNTNKEQSKPKEEPKAEKIDINNASEVEITALPGISIVLAKKIIKKREAIGGFKSIEEVCTFLKLKPHMEKQLRELICVNKMKGTVKIKMNTERRVDI